MTRSTRQRPGSRSRRASVATALAAPLVALPMLVGTASSATAPDGTESTTVTLITGDVVTYQERPGEPVFSVEAAPRDGAAPVTFLSYGEGDDFYVYPSDVADHVFDGQLDEELFNIPGLIRQGLDDASTPGELPVIVTFDRERDAEQLERDAGALPAIADPVAVEPVNGVGVTVDLGDADRFRAAVLDAPSRGTSGRHSGVPSSDLGGDVERIVLDQVLHLDLDESVPQIGAPQAWDAGYTGEGVTVAVLDTGVDASHPDLDGQVAAEADFTGGETTGDPHGHGTHVASTIAGTGAASGGQYAGVAPDATVISGKVCDADGNCPSSAIMAGMEWAAENAAIVNMSLGTDAPSDGTDILSQLLNELSAETGTLFVTSAGNAGPTSGTVSAPGAADAALAVGAVDKSDQLAGFSSRGPRLGDFAVKPDITAPGVGIVAARASGTTPPEPVGDHYMSADGTSMAAPHVAGAAALVSQARPGLDAATLKDALVSTATDGGYRAWEQGTGRVEVPRAIDQGIYATASVGFGDLSEADTPATETVVYANHTDADVTLRLQADLSDETGRAVDEGFSLSAETVSVPAGGQATVTATVDPRALAGSGPVGGVVTAITDGASLRTTVGFGTSPAQGQDPFAPSSTTWTSPTDGWVLGWIPCGDTLCAELRRTTDGGRSWSEANAPDVRPSEYGEQTRVFFAERGRRSIGLVTAGRELYVSFDGARTWQREDLGLDRYGAIDATRESVYLAGLTATDSTVSTRVFSTPIKKRRWTRVRGIEMSNPGGAATTLTDVATEDRAVQASTSSFGGEGRVWSAPKGKRFTTASPCNEWSAMRVGAASAARQFTLCTYNAGRGHSDKELKATTDGVSYSTMSMAPRIGITTDFAVADESTLAIGATGGDMGIVLISFDGGQTWESTLAEPNTGPVVDLDFQDSSHGTLVTGYPTLGTSRVYRTVDGGRTWIRQGFAG